MGGSVVMDGKVFHGAHGNAVCLQGAYVELNAALRASHKFDELITTLRDSLITPMMHLMMLFDPTRVVINAGVLGEYEELFISQCEAALRQRITAVFDRWGFCVEAAREKELACAKGAAFAVLQDLFSRPDLIERLTAWAGGGEVVISA